MPIFMLLLLVYNFTGFPFLSKAVFKCLFKYFVFKYTVFSLFWAYLSSYTCFTLVSY